MGGCGCGSRGSGGGGCCGGGGGNKTEGPRSTAKDPVCGMLVDSGSRDALKLTHDGRNFYFCSTMCMTRFTSNPEAYKNSDKGFFGFLKRK